MRILKSTDYTLYINGTAVTMKCNNTNLPHSLSNLVITQYDLLFFMATEHMSNEAKAERLKMLIVGTFNDNIDRLNKITAQNFVFA